MPFQNEVGEHPTLEDMQVAVVNKKLRPALDPTWCQTEVSKTVISSLKKAAWSVILVWCCHVFVDAEVFLSKGAI